MTVDRRRFLTMAGAAALAPPVDRLWSADGAPAVAPISSFPWEGYARALVVDCLARGTRSYGPAPREVAWSKT